MRPAGWRFFSSPAFPRTRALFFLALSKMRSSWVNWAKTKTISVIPRTSNKSLKVFLKPLSKQFVKIEDRLISLLSTNPSDLTIVKPLQNDFVTDILKNWVAQLEKQLADKNAVVDFLSSQLANNSREVSSTKEAFNNTDKNCCKCNNYCYKRNE